MKEIIYEIRKVTRPHKLFGHIDTERTTIEAGVVENDEFSMWKAYDVASIGEREAFMYIRGRVALLDEIGIRKIKVRYHESVAELYREAVNTL